MEWQVYPQEYNQNYLNRAEGTRGKKLVKPLMWRF